MTDTLFRGGNQKLIFFHSDTLFRWGIFSKNFQKILHLNKVSHFGTPYLGREFFGKILIFFGKIPLLNKVSERKKY